RTALDNRFDDAFLRGANVDKQISITAKNQEISMLSRYTKIPRSNNYSSRYCTIPLELDSPCGL
ncbi:MAG TPA: hypothetical protein VJ184_11890, partial [Chryseolinea sp.]|nr:hypothetical protein [Chryseolinea sp.]